MRTNYNDNNYLHLTVKEDKPLLEFLLDSMENTSRTKIKSTLQGRGGEG